MRSINLDYFNALEDDLEKYARFLEFNPHNYKAYSLELVRLLLAAGSEIDVALKELCKRIDRTKNPKGINSCRPIILKKFPKMEDDRVFIHRYRLQFKPWENWKSKSPDWWVAYNCVKHDRMENYAKGNLLNVINAISALGVIMQYQIHSFDDDYINFRGGFLSGLHQLIDPMGERHP